MKDKEVLGLIYCIIEDYFKAKRYEIKVGCDTDFAIKTYDLRKIEELNKIMKDHKKKMYKKLTQEG